MNAAVFGVGRQVLGLAGQGLSALLLLAGLHAVGTAIDLIPYVGSPQIDYFPMDFDRPFWPQLISRDAPFLLVGLLISVLCLAGLRARAPQRLSGAGLLFAWIGWAVAILVLRLGAEAIWRWPLGMAELGWVLRYGVVNAVVSATLLTGVLWLVGRYADWTVRPRARWAEAGLWFVMSAILLAGFCVAMTLLDGIAPERLVSEIWQSALLYGGLLALAVALTPRPATPGRPGGARTPDQTVMASRL